MKRSLPRRGERTAKKIGGAGKGAKRGLTRARLENKYLAVKSLRGEKNYPVAALCEILKLNRSSYYTHLQLNLDLIEVNSILFSLRQRRCRSLVFDF
jgi:hypothetical protein